MNIESLKLLLGANINSLEASALHAEFPNLEASVEDLAPDEGLPPYYFLTDQSSGIQIRHSEKGEIEVIFLMSREKDGFSQYSGNLGQGLSFHSSAVEVAQKLGAPAWSAPRRKIEFLGEYGESIRYDFPNHSVHFQFSVSGCGIQMITLATPASTPGRGG